MAHSIQTHADIERRVAGKLAAECLLMIGEHQTRVTTGDFDRISTTTSLKYSRQFRHHSTTAVFQNQSVPALTMWFHGIPDDGKELKRGDIINIDVTVIKDGYHGDSIKCPQARLNPAHRLIRITQECMYQGTGLSNQAYGSVISVSQSN